MGIVSVRTRKIVFRKCDQRCAYCGRELELKGPNCFQVDHLHPTYWNWSDEECEQNNVIRGSDDIENLMPTCKRCNKWKSSMSLERFRERIAEQINVMVRDNPNFNMAVDYGMIQVVKVDKILFYFEKIGVAFQAAPSKVTHTVKTVIHEKSERIQAATRITGRSGTTTGS